MSVLWPKLSYPIIVVGHGRGGTSFANNWLNFNGVYTGHENLGPHGIVESYLSVPSGCLRQGQFAGVGRGGFDFENKLCITRNPWRVIATFFTVEPGGHIWEIARHCGLDEAGDDELAAIALNVVRWTRAGIAYAGGERVKAEEWNIEAPKWLMAHGFADRNWRKVPENKVNHAPGRRLTRAQIIGRIPAVVTAEVKEYAEEMGYE